MKRRMTVVILLVALATSLSAVLTYSLQSSHHLSPAQPIYFYCCPDKLGLAAINNVKFIGNFLSGFNIHQIYSQNIPPGFMPLEGSRYFVVDLFSIPYRITTGVRK